jgi:hypothetical protein
LRSVKSRRTEDLLDWSTFKDDLPWEQPLKRERKSTSKGRAPAKRTILEQLESPEVAAFFSQDRASTAHPVAIKDGGLMNEISVAVAAMRAAADAHRAAADALQALSKKLSLDAFDPPLEEKGTPPPSVGELRIKVGEAVQRHGKDRVKEIIAAEAGGLGIGEMTSEQRLFVLIALNAADALAVAAK